VAGLVAKKRRTAFYPTNTSPEVVKTASRQVFQRSRAIVRKFFRLPRARHRMQKSMSQKRNKNRLSDERFTHLPRTRLPKKPRGS
jgi:hypothetical protein